MKVSFLLTALLGLAPLAYAADAAQVIQRDINQQKRIEHGVQSGQITPHEAAKLEHSQSRVERAQAHVLKNGQLSPAEQRRLHHLQDKTSQQIYRETHDGQVSNPNSPTQQRLAADVSRNVREQQRIQNGLNHGSLTLREAAYLERGQAHDNRLQARAAHQGFVSRDDQHRLQHAENRQSRRISHMKHHQVHP
jgi:hypothetical protein